jgi:phage FluMu protein Com
MNCPHCKETLIKTIEHGGMLLRGNAPSLRIVKGRLVIDQKCPKCKKKTRYSPLMVRLVDGMDEKEPGA